MMDLRRVALLVAAALVLTLPIVLADSWGVLVEPGGSGGMMGLPPAVAAAVLLAVVVAVLVAHGSERSLQR